MTTIKKLRRTQGWEDRLSKTIFSYMFKPFEIGQNGCFLFISDIYEAMAEESPISEWRGKFKTKREAYILYRKHAGTDSYEKVFQWCEPVKSNKMAQRGDIGIMIDKRTGDEILGVVSTTGRDFLCRAENKDGLVSHKLSDNNIRLWRVL